MREKRYTVAEIMALGPCYPEAKVKKLWGRHRGLTLPEILALKIPVKDRCWVGHRLMPVSLGALMIDHARARVEKLNPDPTWMLYAKTWPRCTGVEVAHAGVAARQAIYDCNNVKGYAREIQHQLADMRSYYPVKKS